MKRFIHFIYFILCVSYSTVNAQSFDGVSISGDLPTAVAKYRDKGYTVSKYFDQGVLLKGRVSSRPIELYIFVTPKTKKIFKMVAYFEKETSWLSLKSTYSTFYEILSNKYGDPDDKYARFLDPYYEGDGYEMQAVSLDKTLFAAYWFKRDNLTVGVEISKYEQVKLIYENNLMMEIRNKEQADIDSKAF